MLKSSFPGGRNSLKLVMTIQHFLKEYQVKLFLTHIHEYDNEILISPSPFISSLSLYQYLNWHVWWCFNIYMYMYLMYYLGHLQWQFRPQTMGIPYVEKYFFVEASNFPCNVPKTQHSFYAISLFLLSLF